MPALTGPQQVGVREDVSDMLYLADVKDTPFTSTVKKGKAPKDPNLWEYGLKSRATRKRGGVPDGKDIDAFDSVLPRDYVQARSEVFRRAPMVGFIAQARSTNGGVAGVDNEFDTAVADQIVELKRDTEKELLSNQDSHTDDGVNGAQTRGIGRWVWDGAVTMSGKLDADDTSSTSTYTELTVPTAFRTPLAQIYTGSIASMTEAQFQAIIQAKWTNTGSSSELRGFVSSTIKNAVGLFSRYTPNSGLGTHNVQVQTGKLEGVTLMQATVDIYKSDWGTFTLHPVPTDWLPNAFTGYFLDMSQVSLRVTESASVTDLPNLGGGPRKLLQTHMGLEAGDPRAHCKIDGSA